MEILIIGGIAFLAATGKLNGLLAMFTQPNGKNVNAGSNGPPPMTVAQGTAVLANTNFSAVGRPLTGNLNAPSGNRTSTAGKTVGGLVHGGAIAAGNAVGGPVGGAVAGELDNKLGVSDKASQVPNAITNAAKSVPDFAEQGVKKLGSLIGF